MSQNAVEDYPMTILGRDIEIDMRASKIVVDRTIDNRIVWRQTVVYRHRLGIVVSHVKIDPFSKRISEPTIVVSSEMPEAGREDAKAVCSWIHNHFMDIEPLSEISENEKRTVRKKVKNLISQCEKRASKQARDDWMG